LEDLLNGPVSTALPITISTTSFPSLVVAFPTNDGNQTLQISVQENGEMEFDVDEDLKASMTRLFEGAGLGVCIEFQRKNSR
jgi:hypothetical protein